MTCTWCGSETHPAGHHGGLVTRPDWDGQAPYPFLAPAEVPELSRATRPTFTLGPADQALAARCAEQLERGSAKARDRWGSKALDQPGRLEAHLVGAAGEVAFARIIRRPWRCNAGRGYGKPDVGPYQVRTRRAGGDYRLPVHPKEEGPVVLMVGRPWTFRFVGWLRDSRDAHRPEWWDDPGKRNAPAWFVPWEFLEDPWKLPELAALG